ncbi:MAG TPA: thiamine pyrophosphate-dependent enzyme [Bauldia sp.]|nr:thiamine pyrophosphate-dependent enzyme [Bauldia sp.]
MPTTASDILVENLIRWGVDVVFGLPGDGINGIMEALRQRQDEIRFVQVRHEEAAAFMACGYAKFTGRLGVCLATSGPGGIHLLNGLYDAKLDGAPVLAITGLQFHDLVHTFTQQDVELDKLFMDACVYNARIMGAAHVANVVNLAIRTALDRRGPVHLTMPVDMQSAPAKHDERSERNVPHHLDTTRPAAPPVAGEADLDRAAAILNAGKRVCILAGRGALHAEGELAETAELLAAPVAKALLGKGALPDQHPHCTGGVGMLGTVPSQKALAECDTLLIVGSSFPYIEFYPEPGKARAIQIDADATRIGLRYPVEVGLAGDATATLNALLPRLHEHGDSSFLNRIQAAVAEWRDELKEQGTSTDSPMKPQVVAYELNRLLADDTIVTTDSGTNTSWAARFLEMRGRMMFSVSGNLASMACGLPYANAAALAFPERPVIALVGDGGLSMLMGELATTAKYKLNVKIVVIKNNSLGQIKWEQMAFLGNPEFGCELQPIDFAAVARACGIKGYAIADAGRCSTVLAEAFAKPGPALIEATVDPDEPPFPPRTTLKQGRNILSALLHGTKDSADIAEHLAAGAARQLV